MGSVWGVICIILMAAPSLARAFDAGSTATALRLSNTITGGFMPVDDPVFSQMVSKVSAGDVTGAASLAANSKYFANYLARRLALQMQSPSLDASVSIDNDSTAFLIAHFVGAAGGVKPSLSTMFSENATYLVDMAGTGSGVHAASLDATQLSQMDWSSMLIQQAGQIVTISSNSGGAKTIAPGVLPAKHVGGFTTLSDRRNDSSFAMYGATAGTNLRMIEGIWEIATGLTLVDMESTNAYAQDVPRFVPEYNPNFFHGQGQAACISCHGGGMSSLTHGYSAVADVFDFDPNRNGLTYFQDQQTNTRKSLGSDPRQRNTNLTCNLAQNPTAVCNPDSAGADPNNAWDVSATWQSSGVLARMGWTGPTQGQGLNALGAAIGQAKIVYEFMTKRVINEICPMGMFTDQQIASIAAKANPYTVPAGTDDIRTIVVTVASDGSCQ